MFGSIARAASARHAGAIAGQAASGRHSTRNGASDCAAIGATMFMWKPV
jgi:hypothetical protein